MFWSNNYIEYEYNWDGNKTLSVEKYLNEIEPYLKDIVNNLKWKIQLTIANNLISFAYNDKDHVMHSESDNTEIMISDEAGEVVKELLDLLKNRHQNNLEPMKGSAFVFDYVQLLYYKYHKINPNRGGSYIDSPDRIKNKKATIISISTKDSRCFQYAVPFALSYEEIEKNPERVTKS